MRGRFFGKATVLMLVVVLSPPAASASQSEKNLLRDAETYYWFGVADNGDMEAFRKGLKLVDEARQRINEASLPAGVRERDLEAVDALQSDLEEQAEIAHDTLYGVFPLVRLLAPSLFADAQATGTFELIDEPDVIAVTTAGEELARGVFDRWSSRPQLAVVFRSEPPSRALENELRYIFSTLPKYRVRSRFELAKVFSPTQLTAFEKGLFKGDLCNLLGVPEVLVVTVSKRAVVLPDYFFEVKGAVFKGGTDSPITVADRLGLCRDRRPVFWPIITTQVVLLLFAVVLFAGITKARRRNWPGPGEFVLVPLLAFAVGRLAPWALIPIAARVAPTPDTLAKLSFWWPAGLGPVLVVGSVLLYRGVSQRVPHMGHLLLFTGRGGAVAGASALGFSAYLTIPVFLYLGDRGAITVAGGALLAVAGAMLVGSALDSEDPVPLSAGAVGVVGLLVLGVTITHLGPWPLWVAAVVGVIICGWYLGNSPLDIKVAPVAEAEEAKEAQAADALEALVQRTAAPSYVPLNGYREVCRMLQPLRTSQQTVIVGLVGPNGRGKTATTRAILAELSRGFKKDGDRLQVLAGACPEPLGQTVPYSPFREALAESSLRNILVSSEPQGNALEAAVDGLIETVVPFSGFLLPACAEPTSRDEVFAAIMRSLERLAHKHPVVLLLDDIQWIDEASGELLRFLLKQLPPGGDVRIAIILNGHDAKQMKDIGVGEPYTLNQLTEDELATVLEKSLDLERESARLVCSRAGGTGELFWLFQIVAHLARENVLVKMGTGFRLQRRYLEGKARLPVPEAYRHAIRELLDSFPEHRPLLECAACVGMEFDADVLASSLDMPRLELLRQLERVEDEMGVVYDLRASDDVYAFRSSFVLETLRREMKVSVEGPKALTVPQIVREYHARVGGTLEGTLPSSPDAVFEIARHYYAAGAKQASKAVRYCLDAAEAANAAFDHPGVRRFLAMGGECAEVTGAGADIAERVLLAECASAHISQGHCQEAADHALNYVAANPKAPIRVLLVAARACFDAAAPKRDQYYFGEAVRLGRLIVEQAETDMQRAEGHHFVGISVAAPDEGIEHLKIAFELLEGLPADDAPAQALQARVADSLANKLSRGTGIDRARARELYELSLEIKGRPELRDLAGLARSHGGLGRLAFFANPPDLDAAEHHFQVDLELSETVGDIAGQSQMHSLLAGCSFKRGDLESARRHYLLALDLAEPGKDLFFAGAGFLRCAARDGNVSDVARVAERLVEVAEGDGGVPDMCRGELKGALDEFGVQSKMAALSRLRILTQRSDS